VSTDNRPETKEPSPKRGLKLPEGRNNCERAARTSPRNSPATRYCCEVGKSTKPVNDFDTGRQQHQPTRSTQHDRGERNAANETAKENALGHEYPPNA
jgi:hypothetical protein